MENIKDILAVENVTFRDGAFYIEGKSNTGKTTAALKIIVNACKVLNSGSIQCFIHGDDPHLIMSKTFSLFLEEKMHLSILKSDVNKTTLLVNDAVTVDIMTGTLEYFMEKVLDSEENKYCLTVVDCPFNFDYLENQLKIYFASENSSILFVKQSKLTELN